MDSGIRNGTMSHRRWLRRGFVSVLVLACLFPGAASAWARRGGGGWRGQAPREERPAERRPAPPARSSRAQGGSRAEHGAGGPVPSRNFPGMRAGGRARRPHLPEWLAQHQNLTPDQQERLLRSEPGFNRLTPDQQQRVLNRLRILDSRPLAYRERMAERNELFEALSPEGKQEVRAAAQAFRQMAPGRQAMLRHAFNDLRRLPPDQRQAILNSARFVHTYTPQERHMLGSMLSIEPWRPSSP